MTRVTATAFAILLGLATACSSDPVASGGDTLCSASKASTCPDPSACDTSIAGSCADLGKVLTDSTVNAARDCLESGVCGVASCVSRAQKSSVVSDSHKKLAKDYCATCASTNEGGSEGGVENCEASFYQRGKKLPGSQVLPYASVVVDEVDASCTGSSGCEAKFTQCANDVIARVVGENLDSSTADCIVQALKTDGATTTGPGGTAEVLTCTAANCKGCCRNDQCVTTSDVKGCGVDGAACQICSGNQLCTPGGICKEPCGPDNCRGCCDGDTCLDGNTTAACGEKGVACTGCTGGFVCSAHSCIDSSCQATCAGCCTGSICKSGNAASACGFDGNACVDCGFGRKCGAATSCELDTTSLWDFYISFAVIPAKNKTGGDWDILAGLPDPYAKVFTSEGATSHSGKTTTQTDSMFPFWAETPLTSLKASELLANTSIEFWDEDDFIDDFIGGCTLPLAAAVFDGSLQNYTCPASASGVSVRFYYRINPHK